MTRGRDLDPMKAILLVVAALVTGFPLPTLTVAHSNRPNILFILADDMGWSDLGCHGADLHETPNLDRFARESVRFTNAYAMSAVRARDWKLLEYFEDNRVELFNLRDDLSEELDLAKKLPDKANALRDQLHAWRDSVGAAWPKPNPEFKAGKGKATR
jgi:arylsulfatase A-like enzyme